MRRVKIAGQFRLLPSHGGRYRTFVWGNVMRRSGRPFIVLGVLLLWQRLALAIFALAGGDDTQAGTRLRRQSQKDIVVVQAKKDVPAHTILKAMMSRRVEVSERRRSPDAVLSVGEVIGFAYSFDLTRGASACCARTSNSSGVARTNLKRARARSRLPVDEHHLLGGLLRGRHDRHRLHHPR